MNAYLVVGRHAADDVLMRLCASKEEALAFAESVSPDDAPKDAVLVNSVNGFSVGPIISVAIVEFLDGVPMPMETVRNFWTPTI
jgi:hypothetical protein